MKANHACAIVLVVVGMSGLLYGATATGYAHTTREVDRGSLGHSTIETKGFDIPTWFGGCALISGLLLLLAPARK